MDRSTIVTFFTPPCCSTLQIVTHINTFIILFFSLPVSFLLFPCTVSSNTNKNFLLQKKKKNTSKGDDRPEIGESINTVGLKNRHSYSDLKASRSKTNAII